MGMPFFKAYSEGILRGSLAYADETIQLIWIKLLAIANETRDRDGYLRYSEGHPYSKEYIAEMCHVTVRVLNKSLEEFSKDIRDNTPRITIAKDGSIKLSNFIKYQAKPERKEKERMPEEQKRGMQRSINNQFPENARDDLSQGFGDKIISKHGEILRD